MNGHLAGSLESQLRTIALDFNNRDDYVRTNLDLLANFAGKNQPLTTSQGLKGEFYLRLAFQSVVVQARRYLGDHA